MISWLPDCLFYYLQCYRFLCAGLYVSDKIQTCFSEENHAHDLRLISEISYPDSLFHVMNNSMAGDGEFWLAFPRPDAAHCEPQNA